MTFMHIMHLKKYFFASSKCQVCHFNRSPISTVNSCSWNTQNSCMSIDHLINYCTHINRALFPFIGWYYLCWDRQDFVCIFAISQPLSRQIFYRIMHETQISGLPCHQETLVCKIRLNYPWHVSLLLWHISHGPFWCQLITIVFVIILPQ